MNAERVHYQPYADEPPVCGDQGRTTVDQTRVVCVDCEWELRP